MQHVRQQRRGIDVLCGGIGAGVCACLHLVDVLVHIVHGAADLIPQSVNVRPGFFIVDIGYLKSKTPKLR